MIPEHAYMGQFLREYKPPLFNVHRAVNFLLTQPSIMITMEVEFPDISFWQQEVDYEVMSTKTDAIIIRAGQNTWKDSQFDRNYAEAKRKGLLVGCYWFYDGRASPQEQANLLISLLRGKKLELEVYIDWEHNYGGDHEGLKNVVAMMELVEKAGLDIKGVGLYTGYYFFRSNSNPVYNLSQYNYLKTKPLWLAWYADSPASILIPAPWNYLTIWQWGTPAWAWGQKTTEIDMNFFNGTKQEFVHIYGNTGEAPMTDRVELKSNSTLGRTIRKPTAFPEVPHIAGEYLSTLPSGISMVVNATDFYQYAANVKHTSGVTVYEAYAGDRWWKVVSNGETGWIAEIHKGARYLTVTPVPDDTTPLPDLPVSITLGDDVTYARQTVNVILKPK